MDEDRDRFLTEAMGACWHDYDESSRINTYSLEAFVCKKCKAFILGNNDFSGAEDFTRLWKWAKGEARLQGLLSGYDQENFSDPTRGSVSREAFAEGLYQFFKKCRTG